MGTTQPTPKRATKEMQSTTNNTRTHKWPITGSVTKMISPGSLKNQCNIYINYMSHKHQQRLHTKDHFTSVFSDIKYLQFTSDIIFSFTSGSTKRQKRQRLCWLDAARPPSWPAKRGPPGQEISILSITSLWLKNYTNKMYILIIYIQYIAR